MYGITDCKYATPPSANKKINPDQKPQQLFAAENIKYLQCSLKHQLSEISI